MDPAPMSRRDRQAEQTRQEILQSARRLFADRGYARTTVKAVAEAAGVSAQTVYDSIGSKRALVVQLNDLMDAEAGIRALAMAAATETDPLALIAIPARIARALVDNCSDVVHAVLSGAQAEPELAAVLAEGEQRHRSGVERIVGRLASLGALRPDLDPNEATDTLAALTDVSYALLLRDHHGWTVDRIEQWMIDTSTTQLLG